MTPQLCNFNQSKALKALGYSWITCDYFMGSGRNYFTVSPKNHNNPMITKEMYSRPTVQDAIRWFRVEKGVHGWVESNWHFEGFRFLFSIGTSFYPWKQTFEGFKSHDSAENALLNRLIEISNQEKA